MQPQVIQAAHLTAMARESAFASLPAGLLCADTEDFPAVAVARVPARHAAPGKVRRAGRKLGRLVRALWDGVPGPWPVKAALVALAILEPGPFGEMALGAYAAFMAARKARRTA